MPYRPTERLYRDFSATNFKAAATASSESEERDEQSYVVTGEFTTFNDPYELCDGFYEEIDAQAFAGCDMSDVVMQVNHDGFVYARTRNGSLKLSFDDHGGHCEADLSGTKQGREDLYEAITNGLIDRMSFGFTIADGGFEYREDEDGTIHSRITKIAKLFDVAAICGFPANEGTSISARSYVDAAIEAKRKADELAAEEAEEAAEAEQEPVDPEPTDEPTGQPEPEQEPEPTEEEIQEALERRNARMMLRARALRLRTLR